MKKNKIFNIDNIETCPADELMRLFREHPEELREKVLFSQTSIEFFKSMADIIEKDKRILTFFWDSVAEEGLPSLKIKVQKKGKLYELMYLKEKVSCKERKNEFKGRVTLNINQSKLKKSKKGNIILNKKEMER